MDNKTKNKKKGKTIEREADQILKAEKASREAKIFQGKNTFRALRRHF